jgi:hypothetical protein
MSALEVAIRSGDGASNVAAVDNTGALKVAGTVTAGAPAASSFSNNLGVVSGNAKAAAGVLKSVKGTNLNAALRWLHLFNSAAGPNPGDTPIDRIPLAPAAGSTPSLAVLGVDYFTDGGQTFSVGISWGVSTTKATYTAATAADHDVCLGYT